MTLSPTFSQRTWWHRGRPYSRLELVSDAVVHTVGLVIAAALGGVLLVATAFPNASGDWPTVSVYVGSLLVVLTVSFAFNLAPVAPIKRFLARLDQAAIFLLIAGTYTPVLTLLHDTSLSTIMLTAVWSGAVIGIALKLIVPQHFGRLALVLYVGIGWSGVLVFQSLAAALPPSTLLLLLAGGLAYTFGILFHVWEKLHFHNVIWHCFVVIGATIHLWAVLDCMVLKRL
jgi:hemolysin III